MGKAWGGARIWALSTILLVGFVCEMPAAAQKSEDDAAAREYFEAGRAAYTRADYESALTYFRHAYRESGRGALQYNIGLAADRLRRDREALEAFERYLEEAEPVMRETEVRRRIDALRKLIAEQEAAERKPEAQPVSTPAELPVSASRRAGIAFERPEYKAVADEPVAKKKKWPWIVAAAAVVVAGGVTAGVVLSQRKNESPPAGNGLAVSW